MIIPSEALNVAIEGLRKSAKSAAYCPVYGALRQASAINIWRNSAVIDAALSHHQHCDPIIGP